MTLQLTEEQITAIAENPELALKAMGFATKADAGGQMLHGPDGLFTEPGAYPDMFSTVLRPRTIAGALMAGVTDVTDPEFETLTGLADASGTTPSEICSAPRVVGSADVCRQSFRFGTYTLATPTRDITKIGERKNYADTRRSLKNDPIGNSPFMLALAAGTDINSESAWAIRRLGMQVERDMSKLVFQGDKTAVSGAGSFGAIDEFDGFDNIIATGKVDTVSSTACPAADSVVEDFDYDPISGGTEDIVEWVTGVVAELYDRAARMGVDPFELAIAMPRDLFRALTQIWPCSYITAGCNLDGTSADRQNVDAVYQTQMREEMRSGMFLWADARRIPVILDDGIAIVAGNDTTTGSLGTNNASIYFIPMYGNGERLTYMEGFNMGNADLSQYRQLLGAGTGLPLAPANGGLYLLSGKASGHFCTEYALALKPRLVMRSTWLAARIDNVNYTLRRFTRSPFPGDATYVAGGDDRVA